MENAKLRFVSAKKNAHYITAVSCNGSFGFSWKIIPTSEFLITFSVKLSATNTKQPHVSSNYKIRKMKNFTFILFFIFNLNAFCQSNLKIEIDNPEPRVGESVVFSINIDFLKDNLQEKLGSEIELTRSTSVHGMQSDDFERVIVFNKVGLNKVGPFEFEFNGKKYVTNQIEVNVLPKIVLEENVIVRIAELNGQKYIVIEQLVKNIAKTEQNEFGETTTYLGGLAPDNFEFVKLNEEMKRSIELDDFNSSSETLMPENSKYGELGYTYSKISYKINFSKDFKGEYILSEKDFINLPKNYKLKPIIIKR